MTTSMINCESCGGLVYTETTISVDGQRICQGCRLGAQNDEARLEELKRAGLAAGIEYGQRMEPRFDTAYFRLRTDVFRHMVAAMIIAAQRKAGGK